VSNLGPLARRYGFDVLIAVAAVVGALQLAVSDGQKAPETTRWFSVPAIALLLLAPLARKRFAFAAPAAVWLLATGLSFVDGRVVPATITASIGGMVAAFLLGNLRDETLARVGLAVVLGGAAAIAYNTPDAAAGELVFTPVLFGIGWLAGFALRQRVAEAEEAEDRAARAERDRETAARIAVAEERARIARELHDIVAHSVSVMVLQVGAVRHRLPTAQAEDSKALEDVEQAGRAALAEMRRLLGAMRRDGEEAEMAPQPGLDDLDSLIEKVSGAGLPVRLHVDGEPFALPPAVGLSVYRIVQEGLTNALKHARASRADVTLRYGSDELQIDVLDDGDGGSTSDGLGHGLVGIRERVKIYGGEMTAGAATGGGFVLTTRLPLSGYRP
jgi:signal transduction histidine kinase